MRYAARVEIFGVLCKRGHDHQGSGMSVRSSSGHCIECTRENYARRMMQEEKRQRKTEVQRRIDRRNAESRKLQLKSYRELNAEAIKKRRTEKRLQDIEEARKKDAEKRAKNIERIRERDRAHKKNLREKKPDEIKKYREQFYKKNTLQIRIRNRVSKAIRSQGAHKKFTVAGYGIDVEAIANHLGPCPGPLSDWHIDHIRPLSSFDMSDPIQVAQAFAPENHQWLTAKENLMKGAKYA